MSVSGAAVSYKMGAYANVVAPFQFLIHLLGLNMGSLWLKRAPSYLVAKVLVAMVLLCVRALSFVPLGFAYTYYSAASPSTYLITFLPYLWATFFAVEVLEAALAVIDFTRWSVVLSGHMGRALINLYGLDYMTSAPERADVLFMSDGGHVDNLGITASLLQFADAVRTGEAAAAVVAAAADTLDLVVVDSSDDPSHTCEDLRVALQVGRRSGFRFVAIDAANRPCDDFEVALNEFAARMRRSYTHTTTAASGLDLSDDDRAGQQYVFTFEARLRDRHMTIYYIKLGRCWMTEPHGSAAGFCCAPGVLTKCLPGTCRVPHHSTAFQCMRRDTFAIYMQLGERAMAAALARRGARNSPPPV